MQARGPDMRSLGTLPLPGAHITTLTSLANFRPHLAGPSHVHSSDDDASSRLSDSSSQHSELDTDDELEAAYNDRQAANLRESSVAYDDAMSRVALEDSRPSYRPRWPEDPSYASNASFDDWAANGVHANGVSSSLTSQGSFSFTNGRHKVSSVTEDNTAEQRTMPLSWPQRREHCAEDSRGELDSNVDAVQKVLQDFLQQAGLDQHLEITTKPAADIHRWHPEGSVAVQNVLPSGSFIKLHMH